MGQLAFLFQDNKWDSHENILEIFVHNIMDGELKGFVLKTR